MFVFIFHINVNYKVEYSLSAWGGMSLCFVGRCILVIAEFLSAHNALMALIILSLTAFVVELSAVAICPRVLFFLARCLNLCGTGRLLSSNLARLISFRFRGIKTSTRCITSEALPAILLYILKFLIDEFNIWYI